MNINNNFMIGDVRALIVEDEIDSRNNLKNLLGKHCPHIDIVGESDTIERTLALFNNPAFAPDVAFLDINLPDGEVFSLLKQLQDNDTLNFDVIFVTAYERHAIRACQFSAIGFIVKPIDSEQLVEAVGRIRSGKDNKIKQRLEVFSQSYTAPNLFGKLSISALDGVYFVNLKDIVRLEATGGNYTDFFLSKGEKITSSRTIKTYEDMLTPFNFFRVHKKHIINLNFMRKFVKGDGGYLVMDDGKRLEVSRRRRTQFIEQMKQIHDE